MCFYTKRRCRRKNRGDLLLKDQYGREIPKDLVVLHIPDPFRISRVEPVDKSLKDIIDKVLSTRWYVLRRNGFDILFVSAEACGNVFDIDPKDIGIDFEEQRNQELLSVDACLKRFDENTGIFYSA